MRKQLTGRFSSRYCLFLSGAMTFAATPAWAQTDQAAGAGEPSAVDNAQLQEGDIIVTANRRAEVAQSVPIAITAFDQGSLDQKGITNIASLASTVPSLSLNVPQGVVQLTLRGAGNDSTSMGADNSVGFHYNGVYLANATATLADIWDVERVEVLRGPQGTLYGRNTTGGTVNVIPQAPVDRFAVKGDVSYGDYDLLRFRGMVNIPIGMNAATRFSATRTTRSGYQQNLLDGQPDSDDADVVSVRNVSAFDFSDAVTLTTNLVWSKTDDRSNSPVRVGSLHPSGGPANLLTRMFSTAEAKTGDPRRVRKDGIEASDISVFGGDLTLSVDLGPIVLKSISAAYDIDRRVSSDWDSSEIALVTVDSADYSKQYSQEFNLLSDTDSWISYVVGASYFKFENDQQVFVDIGAYETQPAPNPFAGTDLFQTQDNQMTTTSYAVFGQATLDISPRFSVTIGGRYTWDEKESTSSTHPPTYPPSDAPGCPAPTSSGQVPPPSYLCTYPISADYGEPTGKITFDYQLAEDNLLYVSAAHGYKSGAINPTDSSSLVKSTNPEKVDALEIGSKNRFFDRRLTFNLAAYYSKYTDVQINSFPVTSAVLINIPGGEIFGIEADFSIRPTSFWRIDGSAGYALSEYDDFVTGNPARPSGSSLVQEDIGGNAFINTPEWAFNVGNEFSFQSGIGLVTLRGEISYRSEVNFDIYNNADMKQEGYTKTDLRIGWTSLDEQWNISAFVQNLEDDDIKTTSIRPGSVLGANVPLAWYAPPRTFGVTVGFSY